MALLLIVDDNEALLFLMQRALERCEHEIVAAHNAAAALSAIAALDRRVDLVISDVELPDMIGHELVHRIRNSVGCGRALYISGAPNDHGRSPMLRSDEEFLEKPFPLPVLLARIALALQDVPDADARGMAPSPGSRP